MSPALGSAVTTNSDFATIQLKDSVVSRLYLALLDRDVKAALDPKYLSGKESLVKMAQLASGLQFAYTQKGSKYFQDPLIEEAVLRILQPIYQYQTTSGTLVLFNEKQIENHQIAQIIEAFINIAPITQKYSQAIQQEHEQFIINGLNYLTTIERASMNAHHAILSGVLALGATYTNNETYQQKAQVWLSKTLNFFETNGQVLEGPGPDLIHSITSIRYLFQYRMLMNDDALDPILLNSLKWVTRLFTTNTVPLEGMSTYQWVDQGNHLATLLAPLTFYANQDPAFEQYANYYINAFIDSKTPVSFIDSGFTFLKAAEYHTIPDQLKDVPGQPYFKLYESDHSLYCLVGKNYQTAVTLRSRLPLKGLQTWSYKGQAPIVFPQPETISGVIQFGSTSSKTDLLWNQVPETYKHSFPTPTVDLLVYHQDLLQTAYLFTQDATVVLYRMPNDQESVIQWNTNSKFAAQISEATERRVVFEDSSAGIIPPNIIPSIIQDGPNRLLRYTIKNNTFWFTLAGPETHTIIRPVRDGLVFVQVIENNQKTNYLVNLSHMMFNQDITYPGTSISVPPVEAMSAIKVD